MKIRYGFVSNSSTTTFCIYGTCIDVKEFLNAEDIKKVENGEYNVVEMCMEKLFAEKNIDDSIRYYEYFNKVYIGRELTSIKDDETGKDFKESTEKLIEIICGRKVKCNMILESIES